MFGDEDFSSSNGYLTDNPNQPNLFSCYRYFHYVSTAVWKDEWAGTNLDVSHTLIENTAE